MMRLFKCTQCHNTVFFENVRCLNCQATLAYLPDRRDMSAIVLEPSSTGEAIYRTVVSGQDGDCYRLCSNSPLGVCNWAIPVADADPFCPSCRLNDIVPNLAAPGALDAWRGLESAKRRLYYTLEQLRLPITSRAVNPENGLVFSFKQDTAHEKVLTGHTDGLITINIAEADDPLREKFKKNLGERYRTLLGHFRHEIGHYYWDRLVKGSVWLSGFRQIFGDETVNYDEALSQHYSQGAPPNWAAYYLTAYAAAHPWEDWAETWAHYLHMVDTLEMAACYGLTLTPHKAAVEALPTATTRQISTTEIDFADFKALLDAWMPLTVALNSLNRSMGLEDPYPFVLTTSIMRKLEFIHVLIYHWNCPDTVSNKVMTPYEESAFA